jgi:hydroxymethylglutaryl-CoA lyase
MVKYGGGFNGNVCTYDWVGLLESIGVSTGVELEEMMMLSERCEDVLGSELHSSVARSGLNQLLFKR